jgi:hypothetical protein
MSDFIFHSDRVLDLDKPNLKLAFIKQSCNRSNGFPYWCLAYNHGE